MSINRQPFFSRQSFFSCLSRTLLASFCLLTGIAHADAPPAPWVGQDIGVVDHKGRVELKDGGFVINGSGSDAWGGADSLYFLAQPLKGDGTVTAHFAKGLQFVDGWAKAGLMIRESTDPGAPNAFLALTSQHGAAFQRRTAPGGETSADAIDGKFSTAAGGTGEWLKLERTGDRIKGFLSADGKTWTLAGEGHIPMKAAVLAGLAMTPHDPAQQYGFAWFDGVQVLPGTPKTAQAAAPRPAPELSKRADDFVDGLGVTAHFNYDGVYSDFDRAAVQLGALGVRHLRFSATDPKSIAQINTLYARYGIRDLFTTGTSSGVPILDLVALLKQMPGAVEAVEGPNEIDIKQWDDATHGFNKWFTYNGMTNKDGDLSASSAYVTDIYKALHADPALQKIAVVAPSCAFPENARGLAPLTQIDFENMHCYAGGALPSDQLDTRWIPNTVQMVGAAGPQRPIWATECGYHTALKSVNQQPPISEATGAKYFPRLLAEYYRRGITHVDTYELYDQGTNLAEQEQNWGLIRRDYTPKPAYVAEKNLIALLGEAKWDPAAKLWRRASLTPHALSYALSGDTADVHHLLLEKADGDFYLLLWQEVPSFDRTARTEVDNPLADVTLTLARPLARAAFYRPARGLAATPLAVTGRTVKLSVPDEVMIVRLTLPRK